MESGNQLQGQGSNSHMSTGDHGPRDRKGWRDLQSMVNVFHHPAGSLRTDDKGSLLAACNTEEAPRGTWGSVSEESLSVHIVLKSNLLK